tara:strand:- start:165 stop:752 length:588 start_codon:yes stop_codon:yes gene_type:complete
MNKKLSFKRELGRKSFHLTAIIIPVIYMLMDNYYIFFYMISLLSFLILFLELMKKYNLTAWNIFNNIFGSFIRSYEHEKLLGSTHMIISFLIISLFFNKTIVIASMLICIISDAFAAIFGIKYGRLKTINNKTLEGSYAFLLSTIIILFSANFNLTFSEVFIISYFITIIESLTPMEYDNFTVPLFSSIFLYNIL